MLRLLLLILGMILGMVIASGSIAFIIALGIIPRYAGITRTARAVRLYEDCAIWGTFLGNLIYLYRPSFPIGSIGLAILGLFWGIFLGSWIIALEEVVNVYAILFRRIRLTRGMGWVILSIAAGKTLGALLFF